MLERLGDPDAQATIRNLLIIASRTWLSEACGALGKEMRRGGLTSRVRAFYELAAPQGIDVRLSFANILTESEIAADWEAAEAMYRELLKEGDLDARNNLAQLLVQKEELKEAESLYGEAVASGDSLAWKNYVVFLLDQGRLDDAETELRELAKFDPFTGEWRLADFLALTERWSSAMPIYGHLLDLGVKLPKRIADATRSGFVMGSSTVRGILKRSRSDILASLEYGRGSRVGSKVRGSPRSTP